MSRKFINSIHHNQKFIKLFFSRVCESQIINKQGITITNLITYYFTKVKKYKSIVHFSVKKVKVLRIFNEKEIAWTGEKQIKLNGDIYHGGTEGTKGHREALDLKRNRERK